MMYTKKGFSLIEVLVFVTILSLFFVAALTVSVFSLRGMKTNQHKIIATRLAEEGVEWLRSQKEDSWNDFVLKDTSSGTGTTYCLNTLNWSTQTVCGTSYALGSPAVFKRELLIINQGGSPITQVNTTVTVSWTENNSDYQVPINSVFKVLE